MTEASAHNSCHQSCKKYEKIRIKAKRSVDSEVGVILVNIDNGLPSILANLCREYPDTWQRHKNYHFYLDLGDVYHNIGNTNLLKGTYSKHI